MKKIGVLLFVLGVILFGCEKKNTPDQDFQILVEKLEKDVGIVFLEKNENEVFFPIELLEKDTLSNLIDVIQTRLNEFQLFPNDELNERNNSIKKTIKLYSFF